MYFNMNYNGHASFLEAKEIMKESFYRVKYGNSIYNNCMFFKIYSPDQNHDILRYSLRADTRNQDLKFSDIEDDLLWVDKKQHEEQYSFIDSMNIYAFHKTFCISIDQFLFDTDQKNGYIRADNFFYSNRPKNVIHKRI